MNTFSTSEYLGYYSIEFENTVLIFRVTDSGCWEPIQQPMGEGYVFLTIDNAKIYAHRFAYQNLFEDIPDKMTLDHMCENKRCCNPAHLQYLTLEDHGRLSAEIKYS